ncbi:hypothetical protein IJH16_02950 [Candidatus Saccharibacteria bacterium]|nr:hypothetical protein [Candidatus Saccharibacteria bacterium]
MFSGYYWGNGSLFYQGSYGGWWSAAAYSGSNAYRLGMNSSNFGPQDFSNKANGFALRRRRERPLTLWILPEGARLFSIAK